MRSRPIRLAADPADVGAMTFAWTFAHSYRSTADDALRLYVEAEDGTRTVVFQKRGSSVDRDGAWRTATVSVDAWAGQTIHLVFEAVDGANGNLVEAAVDDIRIRRP